MIYYTVDMFDGTVEIRQFCKKHKLTRDDILVSMMN